MNSNDPALVTLLDRKSGAIRQIPCEQGLRADIASVASTMLLLDEEGVWVGTDHGLHRWRFRSEDWDRLLPDRVIQCGSVASHSSDGSIWVAHNARARFDDFRQSAAPAAGWQLSRVSTGAGAVETWPCPSLSVPPPTGDPRYHTMDVRADPAVDLQNIKPVGIAVADDGTIWTAHQGRDIQQASRRITLGSGWMRFDPASTAWQAFVVHRSAGIGFGMPQSTGYEIVEGGNANESKAPFSAIPTGAVLPLALISNRTEPSLADTGDGSDDTEAFWLRRRFPDWLCPNSPSTDPNTIATSANDTPPAPPRNADNWPKLGPVADRTDASQIWLVGSSGDSVVRGVSADISADLIQMRSSGEITYQSAGGKVDTASGRVKEFILPNSMDGAAAGSEAPMLRASPQIVALVVPTRKNGVVGGKGGTDLIAVTNDGIYGVSSGSEMLTPLQPLGRDFFNSRYNLGLADDMCAGNGSLIYAENGSAGRALVSWDLEKSTFTSLHNSGAVNGTREVLSVNPTDGGLWIRVDGPARNGEAAVYVPGSARSGQLTAASLVKTTGPSVKGGSWRLLGATGGIVWWGPNFSNQPSEVRGYDGVRQRWITAVPDRVAEARAMDFARVDAHGDIYVVCDTLTGTALWRYDADADHWLAITEAPAPLTPAPADSPTYQGVLRAQLIRVSTDAIYLAAHNSLLYRYDRKAMRWDAPVTLPVSAQNPNELLQRSIAVAGGAAYVGTNEGLFRMRLEGAADGHLPSIATWEDLHVNVIGPGSRQLPGRLPLYISAIVPETKSVFVLATAYSSAIFGGQLDPATGHWKMYDDSSGFPCRDTSIRLIGADNDGAWLTGQSGVYRYDRATEHWQRLLAGPTLGGQSEPSAAINAAPAGEFYGYATLASNGDETDILANPPYTAKSTREELASVIWRFAARDGHPLVKLTAPHGATGYYHGMFAARDGTLWVGLDTQFYHVLPNASSDQFHPVTLPNYVVHGPIHDISAGPNGGLWIVSDSDTYLWKRPHE